MTHMEKELRETPQVIAAQLSRNQDILIQLAKRIREVSPPFVLTIARGSSDHAATFAKYLFETQLGLITATAAPSVVTLYQSKLSLKNALVIALSQSGGSPDLISTLKAARVAGALTVAFVNQADSPLAAEAEYVIPLHAGVESSVAATKSYLAMLAALLQCIAVLANDIKLQNALTQLPAQLQHAIELDWFPALDMYHDAQNTLVIGRGYSFPIAQEAALKFKETARIHAEAFSSAEILHGPFALINQHFPALLFAQSDETLQSMLDIAKRLREAGARVLMATHVAVPTGITVLPVAMPLHPLCDPLLMIQAFYRMIETLSVQRGLNPDTPIHLEKVTKTW
ncbi:MAG: SIS domain-containing protein [Gammaproteobacteria bacterium]|nr:SIS domain-containing protein [Gammaproteobacteria bacterium]